MDLGTLAILAMFGAFAIGGIVGFLIGKLTHFELGLGAGLLVPGAVCLWFATQALIEYRAFLHAGANAAWGEVTAIEERAVNKAGDIVQPVPVIRFTAPDRTQHQVYGPASGSYKVGDAVSVIYDAGDPARSRVGKLSELRGVAIAMMLFGTFPASLGPWFMFGFRPSSERAPQSKRASATSKRKESATRIAVNPVTETAMGKKDRIVLTLLFFSMLGAILWIVYGRGELEQRFVQGFAGVALALFGYAIWGVSSNRTNAVWSSGVAILGLNFGVWAFALHLLVG